MNDDYLKYLRSPEWAVKRREAFDYHGRECRRDVHWASEKEGWGLDRSLVFFAARYANSRRLLAQQYQGTGFA